MSQVPEAPEGRKSQDQGPSLERKKHINQSSNTHCNQNLSKQPSCLRVSVCLRFRVESGLGTDQTGCHSWSQIVSLRYSSRFAPFPCMIDSSSDLYHSFEDLPESVVDAIADVALTDTASSDSLPTSPPPAEPLSPDELAANLAARRAMNFNEDVEMQGRT